MKSIIFTFLFSLLLISCGTSEKSSKESAYAIFNQYSNDSERDSLFLIAYSNKSTAPSYVVFIARDVNTGVEKEICCEAPFLSGAIHREFNLGYDDIETNVCDSIISNNQERFFDFTKEEALRNISFYEYPEYDQILTTTQGLDLDHLHAKYGRNDNRRYTHFEQDTGFEQEVFAHVMFNCGIITSRDCVAGNNVWFGIPDFSMPTVPEPELPKQNVASDTLMSSFLGSESIIKENLQGAWGNDDLGNADFAFFGDSIFYPDPALWYRFEICNDTLLIIDENDNKESIRVLRLDEDTLVLKYIDYDIIEAYPKRL